MDDLGTLEELRPRTPRTPPVLRPAPKPSPRIRWLGGAVVATAVVIGGITLWVFEPPEQATPPTVAAAPTARTNDVGIEPAATERVTPERVAPSSDEPGPLAETPPELDPTPSAETRRPSTADPSRSEPEPPRPSDLAVFENVAASSPRGSLVINTIPWTHVYIDGRDTGRNTPVRALWVTPGRHVLRLVTQDGHVSVVDVHVTEGEVHRISRSFRAAERRAVDEDE